MAKKRAKQEKIPEKIQFSDEQERMLDHQKRLGMPVQAMRNNLASALKENQTKIYQVPVEWTRNICGKGIPHSE